VELQSNIEFLSFGCKATQQNVMGLKCPNCALPMDFVGRYLMDVRLESAAPGHVKDFEVWRCEKCVKLFVDPGDGKLRETERLPRDTLP
jgi:phage FluMu protein Com